jgi:hypothetical protein
MISTLLLTLGHFGAWVVGTVLTTWLFQYSDSARAYGALSGWWCALYVGYVLEIGPKVMPAGALVVLVVGGVAAQQETNWLFPDAPPGVSVAYLGMLLVTGTVILSPILVNGSVRYLRSRLTPKAITPDPGSGLES